ncbi:cation diffusion facilitator family transporter [Moraxella osloensis]|uniref:Cation transporter n=1 Tax=Faucicola osloensis TaxID=34062 RepID=A0A2D2LTR6_FAUOS|nr:cation diffusion facilitator family transporter [Moraxella osloensis]ATR78370.1 hypothetical protein NP7_03295 [Moraxella osloensis]
MTPKPLQDSKQPTDVHPNAHSHGNNQRHDDADHSHSHSHSHSHTDNQRIITIAFAIIASYMIVEVIGGYITGSLALLSDAGHMFSDAVSLAMTLFAFIIGKKSASSHKTFGYRRFEILIALINGVTLLIISAGIIYEAVLRFEAPPQIATTGMLVISTIGLIVNLVVAKLMHGGDTDNLNMKSAYLHVLSDLLGSVAAIIAAIVIMLFGWVWADAAVSILVALLIVRSGYAVVKNAAHILMEGAPNDIDQSVIIQTLSAHPNVLSVHDLHIWTITSGLHSLSCHIIVPSSLTLQQTDALLSHLQHELQHLGIGHSTIQFESALHAHAAQFNCDITSAPPVHAHAH